MQTSESKIAADAADNRFRHINQPLEQNDEVNYLFSRLRSMTNLRMSQHHAA
jgi:hypothetical protein